MKKTTYIWVLLNALVTFVFVLFTANEHGNTKTFVYWLSIGAIVLFFNLIFAGFLGLALIIKRTRLTNSMRILVGLLLFAGAIAAIRWIPHILLHLRVP